MATGASARLAQFKVLAVFDHELTAIVTEFAVITELRTTALRANAPAHEPASTFGL